MMNNLREYKTGSQLAWTKDQLRSGFLKFYDEHGRFPTSHEIDAFRYLPSARSIQRSYGGLVSLRKELLPEGVTLDHTKGAYRSGKAREAGGRSRTSEEAFYLKLTATFQQIAVHEHKIIRPGGVACDFFIYLKPDTGIVIDVFYAQDLRTLGNIVNIKLKRYSQLPYEVYFVACDNQSIENIKILSLMENRKFPLPSNIKVMNDMSFFGDTIKNVASRSDYTVEELDN